LHQSSLLEKFIRDKVKNPSRQEIDAIQSIFVERTFKKDEIFKATNTLARELALILEGSARSYMISQKGDEITSSIIQKNNFLADLVSVRTNGATPIVLQFLEDSTAIVASVDAHRKLLDVNLSYNIMVREHLAERALEVTRRQMLFLTGTAKERYQYILENDPQLLKKFPLQFIATMIGVTPTQLSRVRNQK